MIRILSFVGLLATSLFLVSCQTLSKDECIAADWRVIGEQDGSAGHDPQSQFGKHVKACEKAGVIPDQTMWNQGYQQGLLQFCTPLRGLSHGQSGGPYNRVCPPHLEPSFLNGYTLGNSEYRKQQDIRNLESRIQSNDREIDELDDKLADGKIGQRDGERNLRRKQRENRELNRDIGRAEADLAQIRREIEYFRQNPPIPTPFN